MFSLCSTQGPRSSLEKLYSNQIVLKETKKKEKLGPKGPWFKAYHIKSSCEYKIQQGKT